MCKKKRSNSDFQTRIFKLNEPVDSENYPKNFIKTTKYNA